MPNNIDQQTPYLQSGLPQTENRPPDGYSGGQLGSRFTFNDPQDSNISKKYQLVQNDSTVGSGVAAYDGAVAYWRNTSGYLVTTDTTAAGRGNVAGVFRNALTLGNVGCIQLAGPGSVDIDTGTPSAAGLFVVPSAAAAKATAIAAGSPATYPPLGVTLAAAAVSGTLYRVELQRPGRE